MLNQADLPATGLIQPASRVQLPAGGGRAAGPRRPRCATSWPGPRRRSRQGRCAACASSRWRRGRPEMRQTLDRAEKFLNLVALLAALLAAVAVGIASRDFAQRHLDDCAMLRVLGLSQRTHRRRLLARVRRRRPAGQRWPAWLLGFAVHHVFVWLLAGLVDAALPAAERVAGAVRRRRGHDAAAGLRPAAGAAAGARAAAARDPARRRRAEAGVDRWCWRPARAGFVALLLAVSTDLKLGADRGRRLCRGGGAVRAAVVAGGAAAARAPCPRRARRAGWCWPRGRSPRGRPSRCCRCRR